MSNGPSDLMRMSEMKIFFSESPPMGGEGVGMSVLAHRLIDSVCRVGDVILTRRENRGVDTTKIGAQLGVSSKLIWDCAYFNLRLPGRLRNYIDDALFKIWVLLWNFRKDKQHAGEIVGLSGAKWTFLRQLEYLAEKTNSSYSVYIVDDYEEWLVMQGRLCEVDLCDAVVRRVLKNAKTIYAICPGMAQRLKTKYGVDSRLLYPIADQIASGGEAPVIREKILLYVGSLNFLYLDALHLVAGLLENLNKAGLPPWRLHCITRDEKTFRREFSHYSCMTADYHCEREQLRAEARSCEALLLPYSFTERARIMVETSFPSKFTDAVGAGRPILMFGPSYCSLFNHLQSVQAPFVCTTLGELETVLRTMAWRQTSDWLEKYKKLLTTFHSAASVKNQFAGCI